MLWNRGAGGVRAQEWSRDGEQGLGQAFGTTGMERGSVQEGQLGGQRGPKADCGADAWCGPTAQDGGVPVTPPHPTPRCPPFDPRALFREEEQGKPARSLVLLGTMHHVNTAWPLAFVRAEASPGEARTPNSEQSQCPRTAARSHVAGGRRGWLFHILGAARPRWGCGSSTLPSPPPPGPRPVCVNYRRPLLSPAWKPAEEGVLPAAAQPHLWPQRAACSRHSGLVGPYARPVVPGPVDLRALAQPSLGACEGRPWERAPLAVAPEPGVAIGGSHRAGLVRTAGRWRPHKGIVCRGKRGFCLLLETGQKEEQFPPFITNSPI